MTLPSRRMLLTGLLGTAALPLVGCGRQGAGSESGDEPSGRGKTPATRKVTTTNGEVTLPETPQRVVVLNYALAGYLYRLDVPVVGVTSEDFDHDAAFSSLWGDKPARDHTEWIKWGADGFDKESILGLDPDLILAGGWGFPSQLAVDAHAELSAIAPTVIVDKALPTWREHLDFIGAKLLGRDDDVSGLLRNYDVRLAEVKAGITPPPGPAAALTFTADGKPLVALEGMGLAKDLAALGIDIAPLAAQHGLEPYTPGGDAAALSTEQAGQLLASVPTLFITGFNGAPISVEQLRQQPLWQQLEAFRSGHAYDLPYWVLRADYDEALAMLDEIERLFG